VASASCAEEDITSLVQTKTIVHHGVDRSLEDDDEVTQDFDTSLGDDEDDEERRKYFGAARGVANMMIKAIWSPSSWKGSWEFNIQEECRDRTENYACLKKERGDCFGDCQWLPREKICKTPRLNQLFQFAKAGDNTPFSLYADNGFACNRRSKEQCEGDGKCSYTELIGWANCDSSPAEIKKVVLKKPFKVLVDRSVECMGLPEETCEQYGCEWADAKEVAKKQLWADGISVTKGNGENPIFKARLAAAEKNGANKCFITSNEFTRLAFGYVEGSGIQKKIAEVVKNRQEFITNTRRAELKLSQWGSPDVIKTRCGTGPWAEVCHKVMKESWTCVNDMKTKEQCLAQNGACGWAVFTSTMCDIGHGFLNENCPLGPDADGSTSADWKDRPPTFAKSSSSKVEVAPEIDSADLDSSA
jgi:hypothetical protein